MTIFVLQRHGYADQFTFAYEIRVYLWQSYSQSVRFCTEQNVIPTFYNVHVKLLTNCVIKALIVAVHWLSPIPLQCGRYTAHSLNAARVTFTQLNNIRDPLTELMLPFIINCSVPYLLLMWNKKNLNRKLWKILVNILVPEPAQLVKYDIRPAHVIDI